jgi:hypothetical protein
MPASRYRGRRAFTIENTEVRVTVLVEGGHIAEIPTRETACFVAFSPNTRLALAYVWKTQDFPWLGIWEENASRTASPWNGCSFTRGMEFGVSPFPETRRQMVERGSSFGIPTYRWIPAAGVLDVEYWAVMQIANEPPASVAWPVPTATP